MVFNDIHSYFGARKMGEFYLTIENSTSSLIRTFRLSEQNISLVVQRMHCITSNVHARLLSTRNGRKSGLFGLPKIKYKDDAEYLSS